MIPLAFTLKVKSRDHSTAESTAWSTDQVHGLLHFDGTVLRVEWAGTSSIDEVNGLEVVTETISLAPEYHEIPLQSLRTARIIDSWWRVRIELSANDLATFAPIPGGGAGRITFRIARRDRTRAVEFVAALHHAARHHRTLHPGAPNPWLPPEPF